MQEFDDELEDDSSPFDCPACGGTGYDPKDGGQCEGCYGTGDIQEAD